MSALVVGAAVQHARSTFGLSQADLARQMCQRGFAWHVTTVGKVERGERTLGWEEGLALRTLIGLASNSDHEAVVRDAQAYRRILAVIGERQSQEVAA